MSEEKPKRSRRRSFIEQQEHDAKVKATKDLKTQLFLEGRLPYRRVGKDDEIKRKQALRSLQYIEREDKMRAEAAQASGNLLATDGYGDELYKATGLSLALHMRILEKQIPFTKGNLAMIQAQQNSANAVLRVQARVQDQILQRAKQGMLGDIMRELAELKRAQPAPAAVTDAKFEEVGDGE